MALALESTTTTALMGGPGDNAGIGAVWVFMRAGTGGTWSPQGAKLTGSGEAGEGQLGTGVALSLEGTTMTALIGGRHDNQEIGAAWAFTRTGSTWTQQGAKLTGSGELGAGEFGGQGEFAYSVALSLEGTTTTALIGGPADNAGVGAAWVFTRTGTTWTQQGTKLTGKEEAGPGEFGKSVALAVEGSTTTALIGGPGDNENKGAAWVFTRSGSTWTQQGAKLVGSGETGAGEFGASVALSLLSTTMTALVGGPTTTNSARRGCSRARARPGARRARSSRAPVRARKANSARAWRWRSKARPPPR